ncbi:MAG: hypothetical protein EOP46_04085 [Sphingobacteriaceae bacterium]|nr:MAG: hypothetical protein EOP46_04085 [Sphingobacteriaceae bacterium]
MATDKKISELPVASGISPSDISVIVRDGTDYRFSFSQLAAFISENATTGAEILFGTILPQNTSGKNGDVFFNTDTAIIYKKINGFWTSAYPLPVNASGNIVLYDLGEPADSVGINGDTFIDTETGIFYKKASGAWQQVFSIDSGPMGPPGNSVLNGTSDPVNGNGANGDFYLNTNTLKIFGPKAMGTWPTGVSIKGTDANKLLNGLGSPSNSTGTNGDFYLDTQTYTIYGPKADEDWPAGTSLIYTSTEPVEIEIPEGSPLPYIIDYATNYKDIFGNNPNLQVDLVISENRRRIINDVIIEKNYFAGMLSTIDVYGYDSGDGAITIDNLILTIKF